MFISCTSWILPKILVKILDLKKPNSVLFYQRYPPRHFIPQWLTQCVIVFPIWTTPSGTKQNGVNFGIPREKLNFGRVTLKKGIIKQLCRKKIAYLGNGKRYSETDQIGVMKNGQMTSKKVLLKFWISIIWLDCSELSFTGHLFIVNGIHLHFSLYFNLAEI